MSDDHQAPAQGTDNAAPDNAVPDNAVPDNAVPDAQRDAGGAPSSGDAVAHASRHENPTDSAESLGTGLGDRATGDIVIDSALQDLQDAPQDDLDAQIDAGQRVQQTLQARLSDLGGE